MLSDPWMDWALGEVVFDGRRWHVAAAGLVALVAVGLLLVVLAGMGGSGSGSGKVPLVKKKKT